MISKGSPSPYYGLRQETKISIAASATFSAQLRISLYPLLNRCVGVGMTILGAVSYQCTVSTILGVLPLAFVDTYIFRTFLKTMLRLFLVIRLRFLHGMVVLLVVMSFIGPTEKAKTNKFCRYMCISTEHGSPHFHLTYVNKISSVVELEERSQKTRS